MKKLSQLKEWLSLADTAKYLTVIFGEDVSIADVLQLAVDGRLTLSIWLATPVPAKSATLTTLKAKLEKMSPTAPTNDISLSEKIDLLRPIGDTDKSEHWRNFGQALEEYWAWRRESNLVESFLSSGDSLTISEGIEDLRGLYDLPMIGGERLDVESELSLLLGGKESETTCISGCFLATPNSGLLYQVQQQSPSENADQQSVANNYSPLTALTGLGLWVVRRESLQNFEATDHNAAIGGSKERNLLRAIAVMAWLLSEQKSACRIAGRPNARKIGDEVAALAKTAFGENARGFDSFHKKVAEALKQLEGSDLPSIGKSENH